MGGQEHEVQAAYEIGSRHHQERAVARRLADHLAHRRLREAGSRQLVGAAGQKGRRQHHGGENEEEQRADLPSLVREQGLRGERNQQRAERSGGRYDAEHLAAPLFRDRPGHRSQCQRGSGA